MSHFSYGVIWLYAAMLIINIISFILVSKELYFKATKIHFLLVISGIILDMSTQCLDKLNLLLKATKMH